MTVKTVVIPDTVKQALGEQAAKDLFAAFDEVAAAHSSAKVDRVDCDAHCKMISQQFDSMKDWVGTRFDAQGKLIEEKFGRFRAEMKSQTLWALLGGLAWITVLIGGLFAYLK